MSFLVCCLRAVGFLNTAMTLNPKIFPPPSARPQTQNEVESIRLRTSAYEMIIAQMGNFTIIVTQAKIDAVATEAGAAKEGATEEKKDGEVAAPKVE